MRLAEWNERYERDGFLRVERLFAPEQMQELERNLQAYVADVVPRLPASDVVYETGDPAENRRAIRNLWRLEHHSPYFAELAQSPHLLQLVARLVNGTPVLMAVELFAKPARVGSAVPYHQDNGYFNLTPPDALTCWVAIDDSDLENGCVYYARGTHKHGLLPHKATYLPGNSWGLADPPAPGSIEEAPGILTSGDAMIHHCCLLHRSDPNRSERPRRGLLFVYRGAHCAVDQSGMQRYLLAARAAQQMPHEAS